MLSSGDSADVTVVVVARERFSFARESLTSVFEHSDVPFRLVYVDGNSPAHVRNYLQQRAREKDFTLVHTDRYLSPNQARNLGFANVHTKYAVFLDNDVVVAPKWLSALVRCAEETGAWVVGPLYCIGRPYHQNIHMAGGVAHFEERDGVRRYVDKHLMGHSLLSDVREQLVRQPSERCEFHCALVRTEALRAVGPLDEKLLGIVETHADLCLLVRDAGGSVWFEPSSIVTYVPPTPLKWSDLAYFLLRWSNEWITDGRARFAEKWGLPDDCADLTRHDWWIESQRLRCMYPLWPILGVLGMQRRNRVAARITKLVDFLVTRRIVRKQQSLESRSDSQLVRVSSSGTKEDNEGRQDKCAHALEI